jgi:predicted transport protein
MTYQAYLDTIQAKTGKTPADFRKLAAKKGLTQYGEIMAWLKADYGLGHGHANVIAQLIVHHDEPKVTPDDRIAKQFAGDKEKWRKPYDALLAKLNKFGPDVTVAPTDTYISLLRGSKKFGIVQITAERMDIGIKLKSVAPTDRFEAAGKWNAMVTHRVRITDPKQIDKDVIAWLKQAYEAAA